MMNSTLAPALPPIPDSALAAALTMLQIVADPVATKARLDQLLEQEQTARAAIADHLAAEQRVNDALAKLADVEKTKLELEQRAKDLADERTKADVTNASQRERENLLAQREAGVTQAAAELHAEREAFEKLRADFRARLAG